MEKENEEKIDLLSLLLYLKKKLWIVVAALILSVAIGFVYSHFFITPMYTASTRVYVLNRASGNAVASSDLQFASQILNDYKVLITGQNVTKQVISDLGLNMTPGQLSGRISVTAPNDTRVLQISITDENPQRAADIANAVREVASAQIKEIMDVDAVNLIYEADVPLHASSPNVKRNTMLAALVGMALSIGILTCIFFLDDTIRTEEDVEHYLGLSTLGVIPTSSKLEDAKSQRERNHKRNGNR